MPTITIGPTTTGGSTSFKNNAKMVVTYTEGNGTISVTGIAGYRTDSYRSYNVNTKSVNVNIGGVDYTSYLSHYYDFPSRSASQDWGASQVSRSGMTGNQTVTITTSTSSDAGGTSTWVFTANAGTPIVTPTLSAMTISNITQTSANLSFTVTNNGGASIVDNYIDVSLTNFGTPIKTLTSNSGTVTELTPNTTYYVRGNASNGSYRGYTTVASFKTLPRPYTKLSIKKNGEWKEADTYIMVNGEWKKTEAQYIKINGEWKKQT